MKKHLIKTKGKYRCILDWRKVWQKTHCSTKPHVQGLTPLLLERLKTKEKELLRRAHDLVKSGEDQGQALRSLESIPGIGTVTAIILICLFRKYENTSRSEIVSLVGVDPVRKESGISVRGKSRISKRGSAEVRKRLYEATLSAARFNPAVKELYQRLKKRGKAEKAARIAAARKLLIIAHAVYKKQEMYLKPEMLEG